jgi:hypothetical protein
VGVDLLLPDPIEGDEPLGFRIVSPDGRRLEGQASPGGDDRRRARVQIEPGWLSQGRYLVELRTREKSHFPIRRFVLDVR